MTTPKQKLQREYAWALRRLVGAFGAIESIQRQWVAPADWVVGENDLEFYRNLLKNEYSRRRKLLGGQPTDAPEALG